MEERFAEYIEEYIRNLGLELLVRKCWSEQLPHIIAKRLEAHGGQYKVQPRTPTPTKFDFDATPKAVPFPVVTFTMRGRTIYGACCGQTFPLHVYYPEDDK